MRPDVIHAHAAVRGAATHVLDVDAHLACQLAGSRNGEHPSVRTLHASCAVRTRTPWRLGHGRLARDSRCRTAARCGHGAATRAQAVSGLFRARVTGLEQAQRIAVVLLGSGSTLHDRALLRTVTWRPGFSGGRGSRRVAHGGWCTDLLDR